MLKLQLLLYSFLVPSEFSISIGALQLTTNRILLLVLFPIVIKNLFIQRRFRWHLSDSLALFICIWPSIALFFNTDLAKAFEAGGILFLETFVPYFLTRLTVTSYERLKIASTTLFKFALIIVCFGLLDTITGRIFIHDLASAITGNSSSLQIDQRFGITRATGLVDHPIIYGSFSASIFVIAVVFAGRNSRYFSYVAISIIGVFTSLSSAPLLSLAAQNGLLLWSRLFKKNAHKWLLFILVTVLLYVIIDIISNRDPFRVMFSYLLFNEHNGYVRYNMWSKSLWLASDTISSITFGYGFSTEMFNKIDSLFWSHLMARSVDSYWLIILLRYGWVMLGFHILLICCIFRKNVSRNQTTKSSKQRRLNEAWLISAISFSLLACTVHFWGSTVSFYMILLAGCISKVGKNSKKEAKHVKPHST